MTDSSVEVVARAIFETTPYASVRWETVSGDELGETMRKAARAAIAALPSPEREPMREALEQANVDILMVLGACRDDMPSEAVEIFQRIAKDCARAALAPPPVQSGDRT